MLAKFEANRVGRNVKKRSFLAKKPSFLKPVAEQLFDSNLLIFRLISFSVPKIMVVRQM